MDKMEELLKELGLSGVLDNFHKGKITPDIVSKLSLTEFETLGISNRKKIMDLRVKCSFFWRKTTF